MYKYIIAFVSMFLLLSCNQQDSTVVTNNIDNGTVDQLEKSEEAEYNESISVAFDRFESFKDKPEDLYVCVSEAVNNCVDNSYNDIIKDTNDISYCEKLSNQSSVIECKKSIFLIEALTSKDSSKCESLENDSDIISCKNNINLSLSKSYNDEKYCDMIISENNEDDFILDEKIECKNSIYSDRAIDQKDISICENIIGEGFEKDICIDRVNTEIEFESLLENENL